MSAEMQLAEVPPKETALQVYSSANGLDPFLQKIEDRRVRDALIALDKVARFYAGHRAAEEVV